MPIKTQNDLPVKEILERENIFVMDENRASHQNIRQQEIAIESNNIGEFAYRDFYICLH